MTDQNKSLREEIEEIIRNAGDPPIEDEEPYIDTSRIADDFMALINRERRTAVEDAFTHLMKLQNIDITSDGYTHYLQAYKTLFPSEK